MLCTVKKRMQQRTCKAARPASRTSAAQSAPVNRSARAASACISWHDRQLGKAGRGANNEKRQLGRSPQYGAVGARETLRLRRQRLHTTSKIGIGSGNAEACTTKIEVFACA